MITEVFHTKDEQSKKLTFRFTFRVIIYWLWNKYKIRVFMFRGGTWAFPGLLIRQLIVLVLIR